MGCAGVGITNCHRYAVGLRKVFLNKKVFKEDLKELTEVE